VDSDRADHGMMRFHTASTHCGNGGHPQAVMRGPWNPPFGSSSASASTITIDAANVGVDDW